MRALPGGRLPVRERRTGEGGREALITGVRRERGRPPCSPVARGQPERILIRVRRHPDRRRSRSRTAPPGP
ncbi:MAG: DUF1918 domain-containing protein [Streptosporangiaceae bacterium]